MPFVLAVELEIVETDTLGGCRCKGLAKLCKVSQWRGGVHSSLIECVECLRGQSPNRVERVSPISPVDSFKPRTDTKLVISPSLYKILSNLILGSGPASRKRQTVSRHHTRKCVGNVKI